MTKIKDNFTENQCMKIENESMYQLHFTEMSNKHVQFHKNFLHLILSSRKTVIYQLYSRY